MSLTFLDAHDTPASTYSDDTRPSLSLAQTSTTKTYAYPQPLYNQQQRSVSHAFGYALLDRPVRSQLLHHQSIPAHDSGARPTCACMKLSLVHNWPQANEHTPMWLCTPAWHPNWTEAEIRREECRRLCWNTLSLTAGYTSYRAALGVSQHELFVVQPANVSGAPPDWEACQLIFTPLADPYLHPCSSVSNFLGRTSLIYQTYILRASPVTAASTRPRRRSGHCTPVQCYYGMLACGFAKAMSVTTSVHNS